MIDPPSPLGPRPSYEVLKPYRLPRRVKAAIGDIIFAGSEIDHLVSMALFAMVEIRPRFGFVLLKRSALNQKLETLNFLVDQENNPERIEKWEALLPELNQFISNRNTLSHGLYRGRLLEDGKLCFALPQAFVATDGRYPYYYENKSISEEAVAITATKGVEIRDKIKDVFGVLPFHETLPELYQKEKPETLKSQRKNNRAKPQRPPRPSQA